MGRAIWSTELWSNLIRLKIDLVQDIRPQTDRLFWNPLHTLFRLRCLFSFLYQLIGF